jgi:hypothetical protein
VRLLVAEYDPASGLTTVDELKDQPRLARGLAATGCLDDDAMARAMETLRRMRDVCQRRGVHRIAAVATAAVREAENGPWFVRRVRQELDIPLRIIDAETEAALSYRSVAHHFPLAGERTLVADIGGGSLELIGAVDGLVELTLSLPLGAVRSPSSTCPATRRLQGESPRSAHHPEAAQARAPRREWAGARVIGSGGTFTTWAASSRPAAASRPGDPVHGVEVTAAEVEQLIDWLASRTPSSGARCPDSTRRARHHSRGPGGDGRAAGLDPGPEPHGERLRLREGCCSRWRAPKSRGPRPAPALPRVRRALPVRPPPRGARAELRSSSSTSWATAGLRPGGAVPAGGGGPAARRGTAGELPEAPQAQLPAHHPRRAPGAGAARSRSWSRSSVATTGGAGPGGSTPSSRRSPRPIRRWSGG